MGVTLDIVHLALGGCLKAPPVAFGITADTGGHIAYMLDAAVAQSLRDDVTGVTMVTRLFDDAALGDIHAVPHEMLSSKLSIRRLATADRRYLEKDDLSADLPAFAAAFCDHLAALPRLPDVIHAHFADAAEVAALASRRFGIPFCYTPHALGIDKRREGAAGAGLEARIDRERAAIATADALIVSTRDEADRQLLGYGVDQAPLRVHCLPPGVPDRAAPAASTTIADRLEDWLDEPDKPILLVIARPVHKKNIAALLHGFAGDAALRDAANVVVVAGQHDGRCSPEERAVIAELAALADTAPLRGRVALPPRHDAADVAALYRRAADGGVFVNPALHEPFGLTILEAAAAGVPVVATRAGGPAEIVARTGHGLLIDPRDAADIAAACRRIVDDAALHRRFAEAGRSGVGFYDWHRYAAQSLAVYRDLVRPAGLLACDIDNTLTGCAAGARAFAAWAARRDIPFVVATGRSFDEARAVLARWDLPAPDAYLVDVGTRIMRADGAGQWHACPRFAAALDEGWDRDAVAATVAALAIPPQPPATQSPHKVSFFGDAQAAATIRTALAERGLAARVVFSHGDLIDVLPPAGGKAAAVAAYAAGLGVPLSACIAAGDSGNDIDMLGACGRAIVVGNADAALADLPPRRSLYRATGHHAAGVMEGLAVHGVAAPTRRAAA